LPKVAGGAERFERQVRNILRVRCVRAGRAQLIAQGETAFDVDLPIIKTDGDWTATEIVPLHVEVIRHGEQWLVADVQNRDEELAARLLAAKGDERERLLAVNPPGRGVARAVYQQIGALRTAARPAEAADASALALRLAIASGDRGEEAIALAAAAQILRDRATAERYITEALAIAATMDDPDIVARVLYDRARTLPSHRGADSEDPRVYYRKALSIARRAEDPIVLARILYTFANITANRDADFVAARRYADEGMAVAREIGDAAGESAFETILTTIYGAQGDFARAYFHNQRALEIAKEQKALAYATTVIRAGCLLIDLGRLDEGKEMLNGVLTRDANGKVTTSFGDAPATHIGSGLRCLSVLEARRGNFAEAECLSAEAAQLTSKNPTAHWFEIAPFYFEYGDSKAALEAAMASLGERLRAEQRAYALAIATRALRNLGRIDEGLSAAIEAIDTREEIDAKIAGDDLQQVSASLGTVEPYELAAELSLAKRDPRLALVYLERGRARVLIDSRENGRTAAIADVPPAMREQQAALDREVTRIVNALQQESDPEVLAKLRAALKRARDARASYFDGLRARVARRNATRRIVNETQLQRAAMGLPLRTVAIEYFLTEHELHAFVVDRENVKVRTTKVDSEALDKSIDAFLDMLARNDLRVKSEAQKLYATILGPVRDDIAAANALVIVADRMLWRVPFAALVDPDDRFVVESKAIVYAPSLMAFSMVTSRDATPDNAEAAQATGLLAVGNPTIDAANMNAAASVYRNASFAPLPDAEHEVDALRSLYGAPHSLVLKRNDATESRVKNALHGAKVAHFATHAILDDANPMYSRLMLARESDADDGWLESWEVARLDLRADLVVLSACDTARGRVGGGEGVIGLAWSFFLAGASSTVATQWKVASDSTADFMIAFHRALREKPANSKLHKATALRTAQLSLLRDRRTRHPFHWAAFVLLGNPGADE
jgi:CHAT domain-containing protein